MGQMGWVHKMEMKEEREVAEEKSMAEVGGVDVVVKEVELHPSWDRDGDGDDDQELVARCERKWKWEVEKVKTRAEAFPSQSGEHEESV